MEAEIKDAFDMKGRVALEHGRSGVIVCFAIPSEDQSPKAGDSMLVVRKDGWMLHVRLDEVKGHGGLFRSAFIANRSREELPIGSRVRWGKSISPELVSAGGAQAIA